MAPSEVICTSYSNREASALSSGCDTEEWNETSGAGEVLLLCGRMCSAEKQPTSLRECLPGSWTSMTEDSTEALQWPTCHKMARQPDNCCKDSKVAKKAGKSQYREWSYPCRKAWEQSRGSQKLKQGLGAGCECFRCTDSLLQWGRCTWSHGGSHICCRHRRTSCLPNGRKQGLENCHTEILKQLRHWEQHYVHKLFN